MILKKSVSATNCFHSASAIHGANVTIHENDPIDPLSSMQWDIQMLNLGKREHWFGLVLVFEFLNYDIFTSSKHTYQLTKAVFRATMFMIRVKLTLLIVSYC